MHVLDYLYTRDFYKVNIIASLKFILQVLQACVFINISERTLQLFGAGDFT